MKHPHYLTDDELRAYADQHLKYEIDKLLSSTAILPALSQVKNDGLISWAANNAFLNTYSIHARNLIDFLYSGSSGKGYPTDILVEDYIDSAVLVKVLPSIPPLLEEAKRKADKQVAHLTLERIEYEKGEKAWRILEVTRHIMAAFFHLGPHFPESRTSREFRGLISAPSIFFREVTPTLVRDGPDVIGIELRLSREVTQEANSP